MAERLEFGQGQAAQLKQTQVVMMMPHMRQGIAFLQAPILEMASLIEGEIEKNPLLDYLEEEPGEGPYQEEREREVGFDEDDFEILKRLDEEYREFFQESGAFRKPTQADLKLKLHQESSIRSEESLYEHLSKQVSEWFPSEKERSVAESILADLDERGYLQSTPGEIAAFLGEDEGLVEEVLGVVQTFEPHGVGARTAQESLLIQLKMRKKEESFAYRIARDHFDDLTHNRMPAIQKRLKLSFEEIRRIIQEEILPLDLQPGLAYGRREERALVPDLSIGLQGGRLLVSVEEEALPPLRINRGYLKLLEEASLSGEDRLYLKKRILSAKWLIKNIRQRQETLEKIGGCIASKQKRYLLGEGDLVPMTMSEIASGLSLHESTIARAVADKYVDSPLGVLPLRSFFTSALSTERGGEVSSEAVRQALAELIDEEDKSRPLSDEKLSKLLKERGICCARRTIVKYRSLLNIGNIHQRRIYE